MFLHDIAGCSACAALDIPQFGRVDMRWMTTCINGDMDINGLVKTKKSLR
jgi:hypothetical protein